MTTFAKKDLIHGEFSIYFAFLSMKKSEKSVLDSMESGEKKSRKKDKDKEKFEVSSEKEKLDTSFSKNKEKKKDKDKKKKKKADDEEAVSCGFCRWLIFTTLMLLLSIPMLLDVELIQKLVKLHAYGSTQSMDEFFAISKEDIIKPGIFNAEVNEVVGYIKAGKNCAVFYSDDPNANDQAIATRVCPQEHDVDIIFHMKSIFGTHPEANNTRGESSVVRYIVSGGSVWTTIFDQHNATRQTYTVPPSMEMNISALIGSDVETFPEMFDAISLVHSVGSVRPTRGLQMRFPECVNFYASFTVLHSTRGLMVCKMNKKTSILTFDKVALQGLGYANAVGEMPELTYIVPGTKASVKVEFAALDGEDAEPLPLAQISLSWGKTNRNTNNEIYDLAPAIGSQWKLRPKLITITFGGEDEGEEGEKTNQDGGDAE